MSGTGQIGILELGKRSTDYYLSRIQRMSGAADVSVTRHSIDFVTLNAHLPNDFTALEPRLLEGLNALAGCDIAIIPNITLHETYDRLPKARISVPISHVVQETLTRLKIANIKQAVVLGSTYTMTSNYWAAALSRLDIQRCPLSPDVIEQVDEFRRKVYQGEETSGGIKLFQDVVTALSRSAPVIIACTELSIFTPKDIDGVLDTADIQIAAAIDRAKA